MDESSNEWFAAEILPHEPALVRFLTRAWPNRIDVPDLRQDIYVRTYEAADAHYRTKGFRPVHAKSFLFTVARNLIIDRIRHSRIVSIQAVSDPAALNVLIDEISPERRLSSHQELRQLADAFAALPPRCRDVVWLRKIAEIPQSEVAERLGISVRTVEGQVQKGIALLARYLLEQSDPILEMKERKDAREDAHEQR